MLAFALGSRLLLGAQGSLLLSAVSNPASEATISLHGTPVPGAWELLEAHSPWPFVPCCPSPLASVSGYYWGQPRPCTPAALCSSARPRGTGGPPGSQQRFCSRSSLSSPAPQTPMGLQTRPESRERWVSPVQLSIPTHCALAGLTFPPSQDPAPTKCSQPGRGMAAVSDNLREDSIHPAHC